MVFQVILEQFHHYVNMAETGYGGAAASTLPTQEAYRFFEAIARLFGA